MKILHIIPNYLPANFAIGIFDLIHTLNKAFVKDGIEVVVYTTNLDGKKTLNVPLNQEVVLDGVKVYYFPTTYKPWQYSFLLHMALLRNIKKFDLVHISSVFLSVSSLGSYYAKKNGKPYVIAPYGALMEEPLQYHSFKKKLYISLIEKKNLSGAAALHFTTEKEKEEYLSAGLFSAKSLVIPCCVDVNSVLASKRVDFRGKLGISDDKKLITILGRISWKKGFDTLIPAFAEVVKKEPEALLIIAGSDNEGYKKDVEYLISSSALSKDKILFMGVTLGEQKAALFRESSVFVLPSYSESFGIVVADAMAEKLPVVITRGVGIADDVERAGAGLVVEKEVGSIAEAILKIMHDPDLSKKMGEQGREFVEREYSCDKIAGRFIQEYQNILRLN